MALQVAACSFALLSTVHLRKTLSLHDGDEIRVEIEKVDVGVISPVEDLCGVLSG